MIKDLYEDLMAIKFPWEFVSEDFGEAKDLQSAINHTREIGVDCDWRDAPLPVINEINKSIRHILKKYHRLSETLSYIGEADGVIAHTVSKGYTISDQIDIMKSKFNACHISIMSEDKKYDVSALVVFNFNRITNDTHDTKYGYYVKSDKSRSSVLIAHEMGHAIEGWINRSNPSMIIDGENITFEKLTQSIYNTHKKELPSILSIYGSESRLEMVAEAFSEYFTSSTPRPFSVKIGKIIDQFMGVQHDRIQ